MNVFEETQNIDYKEILDYVKKYSKNLLIWDVMKEMKEITTEKIKKKENQNKKKDDRKWSSLFKSEAVIMNKKEIGS